MSLFKAVRDAVQKPALYVIFKDDRVVPDVFDTEKLAIDRIKVFSEQEPNHEYVTVTVFPPKGVNIQEFKQILLSQLREIPHG
jgi:hypothetical protein